MQEIVQQLVGLVNGANQVRSVTASQPRRVEPKQSTIKPKVLVRASKPKINPEDVIPLDDDTKGF